MKKQTGVDFRRLATVLARGGSSPATYGYDDAIATTTSPMPALPRWQHALQSRGVRSGHDQPLCAAAQPQPRRAAPAARRPLADDAPLHLTLNNVMGRTLLAPAAARAALAGQLGNFLRQAAPGVYVMTLVGPDGVPQRLRVVRE